MARRCPCCRRHVASSSPCRACRPWCGATGESEIFSIATSRTRARAASRAMEAAQADAAAPAQADAPEECAQPRRIICESPDAFAPAALAQNDQHLRGGYSRRDAVSHLLWCGAGACEARRACGADAAARFVRRLPGVLKQTRLVKDCLHRFCAPCIERSLRIKCARAAQHSVGARARRMDPRSAWSGPHARPARARAAKTSARRAACT